MPQAAGVRRFIVRSSATEDLPVQVVLQGNKSYKLLLSKAVWYRACVAHIQTWSPSALWHLSQLLLQHRHDARNRTKMLLLFVADEVRGAIAVVLGRPNIAGSIKVSHIWHIVSGHAVLLSSSHSSTLAGQC